MENFAEMMVVKATVVIAHRNKHVVKMENALVLVASPSVMEKIVEMIMVVVSHVKKVFVHQDKHVLVENVVLLASPTVME